MKVMVTFPLSCLLFLAFLFNVDAASPAPRPVTCPGLAVCYGIDYTSNKTLYSSFLSTVPTFSSALRRLAPSTFFTAAGRSTRGFGVAFLSAPNYNADAFARWAEDPAFRSINNDMLLTWIGRQCNATLNQPRLKSYAKAMLIITDKDALTITDHLDERMRNFIIATIDPSALDRYKIETIIPGGVKRTILKTQLTSNTAFSEFNTITTALINNNCATQSTSTASPTATPSTSSFPSPTPTKSPTASPTSTPSRSATSTPSASPTRSATASPTCSPSPSVTSTPTASPSLTSSPSASPSSSRTSSPTPTASPSPSTSSSPSPLAVNVQTPTASPSASIAPLLPIDGVDSTDDSSVPTFIPTTPNPSTAAPNGPTLLSPPIETIPFSTPRVLNETQLPPISANIGPKENALSTKDSLELFIYQTLVRRHPNVKIRTSVAIEPYNFYSPATSSRLQTTLRASEISTYCGAKRCSARVLVWATKTINGKVVRRAINKLKQREGFREVFVIHRWAARRTRISKKLWRVKIPFTRTYQYDEE